MAQVSLRPEKVHVAKRPVEAAITFVGRVEEETFKGAMDHLVLMTDAGLRLKAIVPNQSSLQTALHVGDRIYGGLHVDDISVLPASVG
jgi:spermidine/putrescine transport system ATP-binding protein